MIEKNFDTKSFALSNFVVGNIVKTREGLKPKHKGTTIGYLLPQKGLNIVFVYDFFGDKIYELNTDVIEENKLAFDVVNRPWIDSKEKVTGKDLQGILDTMQKYKEDYLESIENKKVNQCNNKCKREKTKRKVKMEEQYAYMS